MLAFNHPAFMQIRLGCPGVRPGQHVHAIWGKQYVNNRLIFATHEEKEYPQGLCSAVAQVFLQICQEYGLLLPPTSMEVAATEQYLLVQQAKVVSHAFARTKLPPLVSEYARVITARRRNLSTL